MSMPGEDSKRYQHFLKELTEHFEEKESPDTVESVGERIKKIRETEGISLEDLSSRTGFPVELLSQIENRTVSPQIGTIIKLAKSLKTVFGTLTAEEGEKPYSIVRQSERKVVSRPAAQKGHHYTYMSLASDVKGRHMESFIVKLEPETPDQELSIHEGEEFIYVLEGIVSLKIGADAFELEPGDSVYYLSTTPHLIAAKSGEATIIAVLYGK